MHREPEHAYGRELSAQRVNELGRQALERFEQWGREMFRQQMEHALQSEKSVTESSPER